MPGRAGTPRGWYTLFFTLEEMTGEKVKDVEEEKPVNTMVSGGISGAITDPFSERADAHAKLFYEEIRNNHSDVKRIAKNTGFPIEDILHVKNFLFIDVHLLDNGEIKRFDESFAIAESWKRLAFEPKLIQKHDLTLLNHEIFERKLMAKGISQKDAHEKASQKFNYPKEVEEFYQKLQHEKIRPQKKFDAGALKSNDFVR